MLGINKVSTENIIYHRDRIGGVYGFMDKLGQ